MSTPLTNATSLVIAIAGLLVTVTFGQVVSEEKLQQELIGLNTKGKFDEAARLLLEYVQEEPDANEVIFFYVQDLSQRSEQYDRAIALVDKLMPAVRRGHRGYAAHIMKERALAILFGRYARRRDERDLAIAKNELLSALTINPRMSEAYFNLFVIYAIQGDIERSKSAINKAIETSTEPEVQTSLKKYLVFAERDPEGFCALFRDFYSPK